MARAEGKSRLRPPCFKVAPSVCLVGCNGLSPAAAVPPLPSSPSHHHHHHHSRKQPATTTCMYTPCGLCGPCCLPTLCAWRGRHALCTHSPDLEAHLVVALAGGAMGHSVRAHLLGNLNLALGDQRARDGGAQQVGALVQRVGPAAARGTASARAASATKHTWWSAFQPAQAPTCLPCCLHSLKCLPARMPPHGPPGHGH